MFVLHPQHLPIYHQPSSCSNTINYSNLYRLTLDNNKQGVYQVRQVLNFCLIIYCCCSIISSHRYLALSPLDKQVNHLLQRATVSVQTASGNTNRGKHALNVIGVIFHSHHPQQAFKMKGEQSLRAEERVVSLSEKMPTVEGRVDRRKVRIGLMFVIIFVHTYSSTISSCCVCIQH